MGLERQRVGIKRIEDVNKYRWVQLRATANDAG